MINAVTVRGWKHQYPRSKSLVVSTVAGIPELDVYQISLTYGDGSVRQLIDDKDEVKSFDSGSLISFLVKYTDLSEIDIETPL